MGQVCVFFLQLTDVLFHKGKKVNNNCHLAIELFITSSSFALNLLPNLTCRKTFEEQTTTCRQHGTTTYVSNWVIRKSHVPLYSYNQHIVIVRPTSNIQNWGIQTHHDFHPRLEVVFRSRVQEEVFRFLLNGRSIVWGR